jgi:hypothetical protein
MLPGTNTDAQCVLDGLGNWRRFITDRFGNQQTFTWTNVAGIDQLASVTDSYSRVINYTYYGAEQGYRLSQIQDFLAASSTFSTTRPDTWSP